MPIKVVTEMSIFDRVRAGSPSRTKVGNGKRTYYYNGYERDRRGRFFRRDRVHPRVGTSLFSNVNLSKSVPTIDWESFTPSLQVVRTEFLNEHQHLFYLRLVVLVEVTVCGIISQICPRGDLFLHKRPEDPSLCNLITQRIYCEIIPFGACCFDAV